MTKLNICIDIDGTITNPYHFIPYLNELYNKNVTEEEFNNHNWDFIYGTGMDMGSILSEFNVKCEHSYKEAKVVDNAKEIIDGLKKNHNVCFVTARELRLTDVTKSWLNENGFGDIDVYLLGSDYKVEKAKELECNIFIEDNPSNAMQLASVGMKVLLIDNNYNKGVEHENIIRVNNWIDIDAFIKEYK